MAVQDVAGPPLATWRDLLTSPGVPRPAHPPLGPAAPDYNNNSNNNNHHHHHYQVRLLLRLRLPPPLWRSSGFFFHSGRRRRRRCCRQRLPKTPPAVGHTRAPLARSVDPTTSDGSEENETQKEKPSAAAAAAAATSHPTLSKPSTVVRHGNREAPQSASVAVADPKNEQTLSRQKLEADSSRRHQTSPRSSAISSSLTRREQCL